jgi:transposase InsO family protein
MSQVQAQARTTPLLRAEIKASTSSQAGLASTYNVSVATVRKWQGRDDPNERSLRPHKLSTTLSPGQEAIVVELRKPLWLPLDDLLVVVREFINRHASRSGLERCLQRHGVGQLRELQRLASGEAEPVVKTFKSFGSGFQHLDIKYLPQMPDESARRYLFVAIARTTRWVFVRIYKDQTERSSTDFLRRLHQAAPMLISKILTDNGSQFTDRFTARQRVPSVQHVLDKACLALNIEHRLSPPRHPQTNGMVERFNGRITAVVQ